MQGIIGAGFVSLMVMFCLAADAGAALVINEVLADPAIDAVAGDANLDGIRDSSDDEFIEIVNFSPLSIDLTGWSINDSLAMRHTFASGTVLEAYSPILVFGGGAPTFDGSSQVLNDAINHLSINIQTASTGLLSLKNTGDTIFLYDQYLNLVDSFTYGQEGGKAQSMTLNPEMVGPSHVLHSTATGSGGSIFSPGTMADGSHFSAPVPLPGAFWLLGSGLAGLAACRRKRHKQANSYGKCR